jgi:Ca2+-binding RTX toxin-like protein
MRGTALPKESRVRRTRRLRLPVVAVAMLAVSALVGGSAFAGSPAGQAGRSVADPAAPTCTFDGSTVTATYADPSEGLGPAASLYQVPSQGGELVFDEGSAIPCGGATIFDTTNIVVIGTKQHDELYIDEAEPDFSGSLPPIQATLRGPNDALIGQGIPDQVNSIAIGSTAMVINGTTVTYTGVKEALLQGGNVDGDVLSGAGGGAAGGVFKGKLAIQAGAGAATLTGGNGDDNIFGDTASKGDTINGGRGNDTIVGSNGDDTIIGGFGDDTINGEGGNDVIRGMQGDDNLEGGPGTDKLVGGPGDDWILAGDGEMDTVIGGKNGVAGDVAFVDCGLDVVKQIEQVNCA